jgi:DNA adenine methylase
MNKYTFSHYIEPFGGSGAVLFAKQPSQIEIYNDLDSNIVNLYDVIRNKRTFKEFEHFVNWTLYSKEEYKNAREKILGNKKLGKIERAGYFFVFIRQSFSGIVSRKTGWTRSRYSDKQVSQSYYNSIDRLYEIHERLKNVQIENTDALKLIRTLAFYRDDKSCSLIYCDPPYIHDTRNTEKEYVFEQNNDFHKELVSVLLKVKGHKILSGYQHEIYQPLIEAGWTMLTKEIVTRVNVNCKDYQSNKTRTECLYCSPIPNKKMLFT